ncbi:MAG: Smr/MutS family protein [Steroidobacterales bacterium]
MSEQNEDQEDPDDAELFRRAMQSVRPLQRERRAVAKPRTPPARARFTRAERAAVLAESLGPPGPFIEVQPGDELQYRRPGVPETIIRRLRRGDYRIEAELDLHGLTAVEGNAQLTQFLSEARARSLRCVRIIHGKGLRSGQRGPVLKNAVNNLLRRCDVVLAFASARANHGGTGATLVLLARLPSR